MTLMACVYAAHCTGSVVTTIRTDSILPGWGVRGMGEKVTRGREGGREREREKEGHKGRKIDGRREKGGITTYTQSCSTTYQSFSRNTTFTGHLTGSQVFSCTKNTMFQFAPNYM